MRAAISSISSAPAAPSIRIANSSPPSRDQELVSCPVAHRVVDELEVVEVDQEDAHDPVRPDGQCPLDAVPEQHPVREPGERVVARPVGELLLQLPLIGDVAHGEHEAADGRIVPEISGCHLDVDAGPVRAHQPVAAGAGPGVPGRQRTLGGVAVGWGDEIDDGSRQ